MKITFTGDVDWESRVDQVLDALSELGYRGYFDEKDYGVGLSKVVIVLMCQNPDLNLKPRIRLVKKEKILYMDVMLDLPMLKAADMEKRKGVVANRLLEDVPAIVSKYKIPDFDTERFNSDFREWIVATGWA